jgi:hypothetical protein
MSDRPIRQEIDAAIKKVIAKAEANRARSADFTWHRRYVLGIDRRLESVERRLDTKNLSGDVDLDRAVEMTLNWLQAQGRAEGTIERAFLLGKAQELMDEIQKD